MLKYASDFLYDATKYPCALFRPTVFLGYFPDSAHKMTQQEIYRSLLASGFRRTFWQLVFPGQVAGCIKRISPTKEGVNEYHIRFYQDGTIECELEVDRWSLSHWTGPRQHKKAGEILLRNILEIAVANKEIRKRGAELIGSKSFTDSCVRVLE